MKFFSNIEIAKIFLSIGLFSWIIGLCLITINHSLGCVTADGCLRIQCSYDWLREEYQNIIIKNLNKCRNRDIYNLTQINTTGLNNTSTGIPNTTTTN